jgi:hypothetical protein
MDDSSRKQLDEILKKEPAALTEGDKAVLRARESYLTADQKEVYAEVLQVPNAEQEPSEEGEERTPKPKKGK